MSCESSPIASIKSSPVAGGGKTKHHKKKTNSNSDSESESAESSRNPSRLNSEYDDDISATSSEILLNDQLYFVLSRFLMPSSPIKCDEDATKNRNIVDVLEDINRSLKTLTTKMHK